MNRFGQTEVALYALEHHLRFDHAESIFIGWLSEKKWSWRVVAGQNVAYDQFPNQYQLFYHGKAKNSLWYDPVFQVSHVAGVHYHSSTRVQDCSVHCVGVVAPTAVDQGFLTAC